MQPTTGLPSASGLLTCASLPISRWHLAASRKGASEARHAFPLVLIHGAAQTATNWMGTPDGRPGWADFFVGQGYIVYIDRSAGARSLGLAARYRREADRLCCRKDRAAVHCSRTLGN